MKPTSNNPGLGSSELPPGPLLVKAAATGAGARTVWPHANPNDVVEHRHVRKFSLADSAKCTAERIAANPRRQELPAGPLEVVAIRPGIYGVPRKIGDRFTLQNGQRDFSFNWMQPVHAQDLEGDPRAGQAGSGDRAVL